MFISHISQYCIKANRHRSLNLIKLFQISKLKLYSILTLQNLCYYLPKQEGQLPTAEKKLFIIHVYYTVSVTKLKQ